MAMGWGSLHDNLPPGVTESMIPGNSPEDVEMISSETYRYQYDNGDVVEVTMYDDENGDCAMDIMVGKKIKLAHYNRLLWDVHKALANRQFGTLHSLLFDEPIEQYHLERAGEANR